MKGSYCLIIELKEDTQLSVGKIGEIEFKKGFYIYVGSALNSLESRVQRHLSSEKKTFWHADYLLKHHDSEIKDVILAVSPDKIECALASIILEKSEPIPGFGCSDCKCPSHLFYFLRMEDAVNTALDSFNKLKLYPYNWNDFQEQYLENKPETIKLK